MLDVNILKSKHAEEMRDAESYMDMAEDCPEWHDVLMDIAHEEQQHAHMIAHIMEHMH